MKKKIIYLLGFLLVMALVSCALFRVGKRRPSPWDGVRVELPQGEEVRAVWASRFNYSTPQDVKAMVTNLKNAHMNMLVLQVRGNGTVFYRSSLEPWSETFGEKDPGWDPLRLAIDEAHRAGIEVHAWINVFPAWRGTKPPRSSSQLWNAHRNWFMVPRSRRGQPPKLQSDYSFISPGNPQALSHLVRLVKEIITRYPVDGIHFDYIRYPGPEYSYDETSIERFREEYYKDPEELPEKWEEWRRRQISGFVASLYELIKRHNPQIALSAAVFGNTPDAYKNYGQDVRGWLARRIIDFSCPMIYRVDPHNFARFAQLHCYDAHAGIIVPGIGTYLMKNTDSPEPMLTQIRLARELGAHGVIFFDYGSLFPDHIPNRLARALTEGRKAPFRYPARVPVQIHIRKDPVPLFSQVRVEPQVARPGERVRVYAHLSRNQGKPKAEEVDMLWGDTEELRRWYYQPLSRQQRYEYSELFFTPLIMPLEFRDTISLRLYGYSEQGERIGTSNLMSVNMVQPSERFAFGGLLGEPLPGYQYGAMDPEGKLWVCSWSRDAVVVCNLAGNAATFSPIKEGLNGKSELVEISRPHGVAVAPQGIVYVVNGSWPSEILRFDFHTGKPLPGINLNFRAGDLDVDSQGNLYVVNMIRRRWHKFASNGVELLPPAVAPYPPDSPYYDSPNLSRGIAVTPDGATVYLVSEERGSIDVYRRRIVGTTEFYQLQDSPFPQVGWGSGAIDLDAEGNLYVSDGRGFVRIFTPGGKFLGDIVPVMPLKTLPPRGVVFGPEGKTLYLMVTGDFNRSVELQRWHRLP